MDEDANVKAPVTRLRRRLSVEQPTDVQSPSTPSTPTKKRAGRLVAKPQLDLIDENTPVNSPKRVTRKSVSRDVAELEDKTLTPSRRSTRVKSNTSIVSETAQLTVDSPRARRLARRNSVAGSDIETPLTPVRQTRRKRKESTSSIENPSEQLTIESTTKSADLGVVKEESDINSLNITKPSVKDDKTTPVVRKSPRISKNKNPLADQGDQTPSKLNKSRNKELEKTEKVDSNKSSPNESISKKITKKSLGEISENCEKIVKESKRKPRMSISKAPEETKDADSTNKSSPMRKTTNSDNIVSDKIDEANLINISTDSAVRQARKSESTVTDKTQEVNTRNLPASAKSNLEKETRKSAQYSKQSPLLQNSSFENDAEKDKENLVKQILSESSEALIKQLPNKPKNKSIINKTTSSVLKETFKDKRKRTRSLTSLTVPQHEDNFHSDNEKMKKKIKNSLINFKDIKHASGDCPENNMPIKKNKSRLSSLNSSLKTIDNLDENSKNKSITQFFENPPSEIKPTIFIEDSNSNSGSAGKGEADDQCVPVIKVTELPSPKIKELSEVDGVVKTALNNSCEPMDIDESTPEDTIILESSNIVNDTKRNPVFESINRSKRKSSQTVSSPEQNKSVVLNASIVNISQVTTSKIDTSVNSNMTNNDSKMHLSLEFSGTPLAQKNIKSLMQTSTPVFNFSKESNKPRKDSYTTKDTKANECNDSSIQAIQISSSSNVVSGEKESEKSNIKETDKSSIVGENNESTSEDDSEDDEGQSEKSSSRPDIQGSVKRQTSRVTSSKKLNESKNDVSHKSDSDEESDSEENDESEDISPKRSNFLEDEADDAGDDYESGDSQDDEEKQYEKENEITEKGEILTSDEEFSDDSDYEKDSFVVSSDAEDEELLSGSGDDLSMSDNELTMSAKSKKKFNERMAKQQKKASREMFEARHNISNKSDASDVPKPSKNKNRLRLDSSMLESGNESVTKEPSKKAKRLSQTINENEITNVFDISVTAKEDPLVIKVKPEPKTPQKDFNISTVNLTYREEMEAVNVQENMSIMKTNETSDPLQDSEDSDDVSISENEEIKKDFESVLKKLQKENKTKKNKSQDISLNLNKKGKNKKASIVEELNLTETKPSKVEETQKAQKDRLSNPDSEDSNSGLDIKLIFNEDSNDSEFKSESGENKADTQDTHIPLKRTEASTNLLESMDVTDNVDESSLNISKKKNKRKVSESKSEKDTEELNFFIDTKGDYGFEDQADKSLTSKSNKKKNKDTSNTSIVKDVSKIIEESELNTSKKKKNKISESENTTDRSVLLNASKIIEESELNTSKKKKNKKISESENTAERSILLNASKMTEESTELNTSKKKKNKKNSESENIADRSIVLNASKIAQESAEFNTSKKKKNKTNSESESTAERSVVIETDKNNEESSVINTSMKKKNKNKKNNQSQSQDADKSIVISKEEVESLNFFVDSKGEDNDAPPERSSKKKKNKNNSVSFVNDNENASFFIDTKGSEDSDSSKNNLLVASKKKKKNSVSFSESQEQEAAHNISSEKPKKAKTVQAVNTSIDKTSKKYLEAVPFRKSQEINVSLEKSNANRKRKASADLIVCETPKDPETTTTQNTKRKRRKVSENTEQPSTHGTNKTKKRKDRDEEDESKDSKIRKENFFSRVHVPRLPEHILSQIEDKPKYPKVDWDKAKSKVISTTQFVVEDTKTSRRNKPSNFLEETVCLNDDDEEDSPKVKKQKKFISKPKVLPFVPSVSISSSGCTTNFKISVIPKDTKFVAQTATTANFRNDCLQNRKKKYGTYELYKKHRQMKLSKF